MGTYYQYANLDRQEIISLAAVANINAGGFGGWSLQAAVLQCFLGFDFRSRCYFDGWTGRWAGQRIQLESDAEDHESDEWDHPACDAGVAFVLHLHRVGDLQRVMGVWGLADDHARVERELAKYLAGGR